MLRRAELPCTHAEINSYRPILVRHRDVWPPIAVQVAHRNVLRPVTRVRWSQQRIAHGQSGTIGPKIFEQMRGSALQAQTVQEQAHGDPSEMNSRSVSIGPDCPGFTAVQMARRQ